MENRKKAFTEELKELLEQWHFILTNPDAILRDYIKCRVRIQAICDELDAIERNEVSL